MKKQKEKEFIEKIMNLKVEQCCLLFYEGKIKDALIETLKRKNEIDNELKVLEEKK